MLLSKCIPTLLLLGAINLANLCLFDAAPAADPMEKWLSAREGLKTNKQQMCASMLRKENDSEEGLTMEKVKDLFEESLDNMVRASEHMNKIHPFIDENARNQFDNKGGSSVLDISENRRKLIDEYRKAESNGASQEELGEILEKYFYKACATKIAMAITEQSLAESSKKIQRIQLRKSAIEKSAKQKSSS